MEATQMQVHRLLVSFLHDKHLLNWKHNFIPFINILTESFLTNLSATYYMIMLMVSVNKDFVCYKLRTEFKLQTIPIYCHAVLQPPDTRDPYFNNNIEDLSRPTFLLLNYSIHTKQTHHNQICLNWRVFLVYHYFMVFSCLSLILTFIPNWQRNFLQKQQLRRTVQNYTGARVKGYCAIVHARIILYIRYLMIFLQLAKHCGLLLCLL